jgi:hypothetical protein
MLDLETIGFLKEFHRVHGKDNEKMNKLAWDTTRYQYTPSDDAINVLTMKEVPVKVNM